MSMRPSGDTARGLVFDDFVDKQVVHVSATSFRSGAERVSMKTPIWFVCIEGRYGICNFNDINFSDIHTVFIFNLRINGRVNLRYFLVTCRGRIINYFILCSKQVKQVPNLLMCLHSAHRSRVLPVATLSAMRDIRKSDWFLAAQRTK